MELSQVRRNLVVVFGTVNKHTRETILLFPLFDSPLFVNQSVDILLILLTAKAIGPSGSIILTDGDSEVVEIALQNIESNNVQNNATATTLFWNDEEKIQEILNTHNINHNYTNNTTSATNAVESDGRFDIIIASDCLYRNSANTKILFSLAAAMLKRNHTASNTNTMQSVDHSATTTTHSTDEPQPNPVTSTEISQPEVEDTDTDLLQPSGDGGGWYYPSAHDHSVESDAKYTIASSYKPVVQYDLETNILEQSNCSSSTTNNTPQKNEYSTDYNNTTSTTNTSSIKDSRQPVFILAFTRRLDGNEASIDVIFQAAKEVGFEYEIAYDSVIDMFGNITCERTMMWEHCIFIFTWKK